ncbi:hypothetical protein LSH36_166g01037 [Paralvinella palmiformis]|uniref:Caveolin n=1 Tax=Paralvinella palmiformis TaxID=53620 RepID=A0AAD9N878_9ANNE|nr:hypothetical protein LSH36_166g01037 [Paralvinella palmiformis]
MPACEKLAPDCDLEERDINDLNDHIKIQFEDVFGEEKGSARSIDCVWRGSYCCFNGTLSCCYKTLSLLCAIPMAFCWACEFACLACYHVWCLTPQLRYYTMMCMPIKKLSELYLSVCCGPFYETCGLIFSKIVVTNKTG